MSPAKQSRTQTVQWLMPDCESYFSLPKEGSKPDLHPRPPDLHQNVRNIIRKPLVSCWHRGETFGNPLSDRDFHPAHLSTQLHKLSVQGCLDMSN